MLIKLVLGEVEWLSSAMSSEDEVQKWREVVENRLGILESRDVARERPVRSDHRKTVIGLLMVYLLFTFVSMVGNVTLNLMFIEFSPVFGLLSVLNLGVGLVGVAFAFAVYQLAKETYQHIRSSHPVFIPQTTGTKLHPVCYICNRSATHMHDGRWVCDEHGIPKRPVSRI